MPFFSDLAPAILAGALLCPSLAQSSPLADVERFLSRQASQVVKQQLGEQEALALYTREQRQPSFSACTDLFPGRRPIAVSVVSPEMRPVPLCSDHFAVLYSQRSKTPLVVVERLTAEQLQMASGRPRTDEFVADPRLSPSVRAELADYRGAATPVDRGHMAPAADAPSERGMQQSFVLSNIIPQDPGNNQRVWSKVESDVRKYVRRATGAVYVYTGPLFDAGTATIGAGRVWVPTRIFKLVYDEARGRAWAYVLPNAETAIEKPMDYASFVRMTGLHLLDGL